MADPVWPSTLPQAGANGASGGPQSNVVSFEPEVGPSIDRRRASTVSRIRDVTLPLLTNAQYATFKTFFDDTLKSGVLPFTWVDPISKAASRVKFVQKDRAYTEKRVTLDYVEVTFQIATMR